MENTCKVAGLQQVVTIKIQANIKRTMIDFIFLYGVVADPLINQNPTVKLPQSIALPLPHIDTWDIQMALLTTNLAIQAAQIIFGKIY